MVKREVVILVNASGLYFKGILSSVYVTQKGEKWLISFAHHGNQPTLFFADPIRKARLLAATFEKNTSVHNYKNNVGKLALLRPPHNKSIFSVCVQ